MPKFVNFVVAPAPLKILTTSVPTALVKAPYSVTLDAQGGIAPYTWKVASGQLPGGLSLAASSGMISGVPTQTGQFFFLSRSRARLDRSSPLHISSSAPPTTPTPPTPATDSDLDPDPNPTHRPLHRNRLSPELPRTYIDTSVPTQTGLVINVPTGGDFQGALNSARCGDTIQLAEGATFTGNFILPAGSCDGWVVVRTSKSDSNLPGVETRITPAYSNVLAKIVSPNSVPAITARFGANHFRFVGVEVTTTFSTLEAEQYELVDFGEDPETGQTATSLSELPHELRLTAATYTVRQRERQAWDSVQRSVPGGG